MPQIKKFKNFLKCSSKKFPPTYIFQFLSHLYIKNPKKLKPNRKKLKISLSLPSKLNLSEIEIRSLHSKQVRFSKAKNFHFTSNLYLLLFFYTALKFRRRRVVRNEKTPLWYAIFFIVSFFIYILSFNRFLFFLSLLSGLEK